MKNRSKARLLGLAVSLVGIINIVSALTPSLSDRFATLRELVTPLSSEIAAGATAVLGVALLLVGSVWAVWDDNISRRPWKEYQVKWDRIAYDHYMQQAAEEEKRLKDAAFKDRLAGAIFDSVRKFHDKYVQARSR